MLGIAQQIRRILQGIVLDHLATRFYEKMHVVPIGQSMVQPDADGQVYLVAAHLQFAIAYLRYARVFVPDREGMFHPFKSKPGQRGHVQQVDALVAVEKIFAFLHLCDDASALRAEIGQVFKEREVREGDLLVVFQDRGRQIEPAIPKHLSVLDAEQEIRRSARRLRGGVHVSERNGKPVLFAIGIERRYVQLGVHVEKGLGECAEKAEGLFALPTFERYNFFAVTVLHVELEQTSSRLH